MSIVELMAEVIAQVNFGHGSKMKQSERAAQAAWDVVKARMLGYQAIAADLAVIIKDMEE
jgi:hypothetical protein